MPADPAAAEVVDEGGASTTGSAGEADGGEEVGPSTSTTLAPPAMGAEGAFDAETGRPLRVLVRATGSDSWHWIDAQTGVYIGPGLAPGTVDFDPENLVAARAEVPINCEDEGSGLHVRVGHATVQKSGRFIASESVFQNTDCSGEPFAWRAVAIDRDTGAADVRFRFGDGATAVTELQYDPTGTWLLFTLADGSLEWQGGSGRVELVAQGADGQPISVAEASWGVRPPFGQIPGRAFVPNASEIDDPGVAFPPARVDLEHGGDAWAVVLAATPFESQLLNAIDQAAAQGFVVGATDCDRGAVEAFGWTSSTVGDTFLRSVSVVFASEADARAAAAKFEAAGIPAVPTVIQTYCLD